MQDKLKGDQLSGFTTPHLADACLRAGVPVRCAPASVRGVVAGSRASGRVRPTQHAGSVDIFLEALSDSSPGDVLVVDNAGRLDEACVGDLIALETKAAGLAGIVIWGLHRDTREIAAIGLPVFSLGSLPTGPLRLNARGPDALRWAAVGPHLVSATDYVVADDDGVLFLPQDRLANILSFARQVRDTEARQAEAMAAGTSLRRQLRFDDYLSRRDADPTYTFRQHLRDIAGSIEE
jgi:4-hydroxy-4-methyl-2-oxoglutarate aldolase